MNPNKKNNNTLYIAFGIIAYLFCCFLGCHIGTVFEQNPNGEVLDCLLLGLTHMSEKPFELIFSAATFKAIGIASIIFIIIVACLVIDAERNKRDMPGKESGSAAWNNDLNTYNKTYSDPHGSPQNNGPYNMILTQNVFLNMNTRDTRRNNNVLVVGGSGSGKSRFYVKPNLLQANANYVVTDPKGELLQTTGHFLEEQGYEIKVFNLVEMSKSNCYNPFNYIRDEQGVLMMINCLIKNTNPPGKSSGDPFWEKSETALLQALCFYLIKYRPKEDQNFTSVMRLLRAAEINEQNPNAKSKLDLIFDEVEAKDPTSIAVKQYKTFKMGAGKTLKSILISCSVRLTVFNLRQIEALTGVDNLELEKMGEGKKALFVVIPTADSTYNFLVSMLYSQLFETLYYTAETKYESIRLPRHLRFLLDEFVNVGQIPEFDKKLATMRQYEISCNIIIQNLAQLKAMYENEWGTIIGNCDSFLFLGGQEYDTTEYVSKILGDQTLTVRNRSMSTGKSKNASKSFNTTGRKLMFPDEIARMDNSNCILLIRGLRPFFDKKYEYTKHPNYPRTGDADKKLNYVNTINNNSRMSGDEIDTNYAAKKAQNYSQDVRKVINETDINNICQTFGITKASQVFERFVAIKPTPPEKPIKNDIISSEIKQSSTQSADSSENAEITIEASCTQIDEISNPSKPESQPDLQVFEEASYPVSESSPEMPKNESIISNTIPSHQTEQNVPNISNNSEYEIVTPPKPTQNKSVLKSDIVRPQKASNNKKITKDPIPDELVEDDVPSFEGTDTDGQENWYFL